MYGDVAARVHSGYSPLRIGTRSLVVSSIYENRTILSLDESNGRLNRLIEPYGADIRQFGDYIQRVTKEICLLVSGNRAAPSRPGRTTMSEEKINRARRKVLGGIGGIGIASAGAGLGTTAYFSDQEEFTDNTIRAGEFGLSVKQAIKDIDQDGIGPDEMALGDNEEGVWAMDTITIEDAKPGDEYKFCWKLKVHDNPGYVAVAGDYTDDNGVDAENVELDDLWDINDEEQLSTLGDETLVDSLKIKNGEDGPSYEYGDYFDTLGELLEALGDGELLHDDGSNPITFDPDKKWILCVKLRIPTTVGNEIQGAKLTWNKTFYAEQARHNDDMDAFVGRAEDAHSGA